jgi:branched-chain amino acid transport system ATP-binding protein
MGLATGVAWTFWTPRRQSALSVPLQMMHDTRLGLTGRRTDSKDPPRPDVMLRAAAVSRSFDGVVALQSVSLELSRREVVGLIGPNGAGKSTLVNLLTGFDFPSSGTIEFEGRDITRWTAHRRSQAGLTRTFQHSRSFRSLTVRENVEVAALGVGAGPREARRRANDLLERLDLAAYANMPAAALAHGDERRLGVARALATEPKYLLMDEPAAGLPEAEIPAFAAVIRSVCGEHGAGVLLIDHNMALVMDVCDWIQVLDQGRTLAQGPPAEIRANLDVAAAYLGEAAVHESA